jgi:hypothetical protein
MVMVDLSRRGGSIAPELPRLLFIFYWTMKQAQL